MSGIIEHQCFFCPFVSETQFGLRVHQFNNHGFNCQQCAMELDCYDSFLVHSLHCDWSAQNLLFRDQIEEVESRFRLWRTPRQ